MHRLLSRASAGLALLGLVAAATACAGARGLDLDARSGSELRGRFAGEAPVHFELRRTVDAGLDVVTGQVTVGDGKAFTAKASPERGAYELEGQGASLEEAERTALRALADAMDALPAQPDSAGIEAVLAAAVGYLASTPPGSPVARLSSDTRERSLGDEGVRCIAKGTVQYGEWDDARGRHRLSMRVDASPSGYPCMGRCGSGCGLVQNYTKDCLDHDMCAYKNGLGIWSTGSSANCLDEFQEAQDDFWTGAFRGCDGR